MRIIRMLAVAVAVAGSLALGTAALAAEPKCPLALHDCLEQYTHMRERPWLGVWIEADSVTGARRVERVIPGGTAEAAGVRPGDELKSIGGKPPAEWFAGKAGWRTGDRATLAVNRDGRTLALEITLVPIADETLAQLMGAHLLAGHLAYGDLGRPDGGSHGH